MLFVCYPKCSTCKKAQTWLEGRGLSFQLRDIKTDNPTAGELKEWHRRSGLPLRRRPVDQLRRGGLAESAARLDLRLRGGPLRRHTFVPPDPHIPGRGRKPPASRLWPGGTAV